MSKALAALGKSSFEGIPTRVRSRPVILESWERSRISGVDPESKSVPLRTVSQEELQRRLRINKGLLAASIPHMEWLGEALGNVPYAVYLIDPEGIVLSSNSNSPEIQQTFGILPGSDTSERIIGTNGPGTALVINQPITVVGSEHFCRRFCGHTTIGASICSSGDAVLGAIGVVSGISDGMQQLSYLVTHSARLVNRELIYREEHRRAESFKLLARVLSITDAALIHVSLDDLLNDLLNRIRKVLEFDVAAVLLKEPSGDTLLIQTPEGLKKESAGVIRVPGDKQFGRRVIGRCDPTIFDDIETNEEYSPIFREYGIRSAIGARLVVEDWIIGALCVGTPQRRRFNESHTRLLSLVADRVALAIDRARSYEGERAERIDAQATNYAKDEVLASASQRLTHLLDLTTDSAKHLQNDNPSGFGPGSSVDAIKRHTAEQAEILGNIREVFAIINGTLRLNTRQLDLISIIRTAVEILVPLSREKEISIQTIFDPAIAMVSGDFERVQQVVWHLLSNAIKFTPTGGQVKITLERVDSNAQITIGDTGRGIAEGFLPYIFDLFPPDGILQTQYEPQGFGLAIVRHIVELHRGTICAESPGEGFGATFTVRLPLVPNGLNGFETKPDVRGFPAKEGLAHEAFTRLDEVSVLIVGDRLDLLAAILVEWGAIVKDSSTIAVEELNHWRPDIVVSSFKERSGGSYKLITKVKDLETARRQSIPTASLASCAVVNYWMNAPTAESQVSIPDPVEPSKLAAAVFRLVHAKRE
jgi:signal transduction histidine kinase